MNAYLLQEENFFSLKMMENTKLPTVGWNLHHFTKCFWKYPHSEVNIHSNVLVCRDQIYLNSFWKVLSHCLTYSKRERERSCPCPPQAVPSPFDSNWCQYLHQWNRVHNWRWVETVSLFAHGKLHFKWLELIYWTLWKTLSGFTSPSMTNLASPLHCNWLSLCCNMVCMLLPLLKHSFWQVVLFTVSFQYWRVLLAFKYLLASFFSPITTLAGSSLT